MDVGDSQTTEPLRRLRQRDSKSEMGLGSAVTDWPSVPLEFYLCRVFSAMRIEPRANALPPCLFIIWVCVPE